MEDVLTEKGKRLAKQGLFLGGLLLAVSSNVGSSVLFVKSADNLRSDSLLVGYGILLVALMVAEVAAGRFLKHFSIPFGTGIAFGGWLALATPLFLLWGSVFTK
jgi:hypothetical protein